MSNTAQAVVTLTDARVARGQAAWSRIKATAAEQRELWRDVGEALLVGRKLHKADQKFSQWCKEMGFGDMDRRVRADAMWLAEVSGNQTPPWPTGVSNPGELRRWFNEQKTTESLPEELQGIEAEKVETIEIDQRSAERIAKVINRAKSGDEGAAIAKRHVEALAKKHNTTPEKLEEAAAVASPTTYFQFTPDLIESINEMKQGLIEDAAAMRKAGITKEAIVAIYMNVINQIKKEF